MRAPYLPTGLRQTDARNPYFMGLKIGLRCDRCFGMKTARKCCAERSLARHSIAYRHTGASILGNEHDIAGLYLAVHGFAASPRRLASIPNEFTEVFAGDHDRRGTLLGCYSQLPF